MANNLMISDEEYEEYKCRINTLGEYIEKRIAYLAEQILEVYANGITEGKVHENLGLFLDALIAMEGQLTFFTDEMGRDAIEFVHEVEERDCSIYEGGR